MKKELMVRPTELCQEPHGLFLDHGHSTIPFCNGCSWTRSHIGYIRTMVFNTKRKKVRKGVSSRWWCLEPSFPCVWWTSQTGIVVSMVRWLGQTKLYPQDIESVFKKSTGELEE